jgi:hypothetical protein
MARHFCFSLIYKWLQILGLGSFGKIWFLFSRKGDKPRGARRGGKLWTAATCRRFENVDVSAHSKTEAQWLPSGHPNIA